MNANPEPHAPVQPDLEGYEYEDDGFAETLPVRPRRPFLTKWSAALMALALGGVGFYVGVRVEKTKIPASSGAGGLSSFARALGGGTSTSSTTGAGSFASRFGGAGGLASAFAGANSNATIGSVSSVNGKTIYVTSTSGNTVKVKLTGNTTITKTVSVKRSKIYPGDEVTIEGVKGKGGTISATSVSDSGARSTGGGASSGSSSSSSVIGSLFGGGG